MRSVLACVLCLIASASALVAGAPMQQQQLAARTAATQMSTSGVVRVEIELEQGEPYAASHPSRPVPGEEQSTRAATGSFRGCLHHRGAREHAPGIHLKL